MSVASHFGKQHVIITGGSSGIGLALAKMLVEVDAEVTLVARRQNLLDEAKQELIALSSGARIHTLSLDVSDAEAVQVSLQSHLEQHPARFLINNAGVAHPGRFMDSDPGDFTRQMDINFHGAVNMCRAVIPHLIEQGGGHVCNVGSLLSVMGIYGYSAYAASKFALQGFTECIRGELQPHGVKVTMLLPPDTDTPQHAQEMALLPEETKAIAGTVKMLEPEAVARACLTGMAAGRFEIVPGMDGRFTVVAHRWMPGVVRWYCDMAQKKVQKRDPGGRTRHV